MELKHAGLGFVQVFWGNGKGKTTSALGSALRACGNGYKVHLVQFMKNGASSLEEQIPGEIKALEKFDNFSYKRFGTGGWVIKKPTEAQIAACKNAYGYILSCYRNDYNIIIADEILYAVQLELLKEENILNLIDQKPADVELILTGSHVPFPRLFEKAHLITEIKKPLSSPRLKMCGLCGAFGCSRTPHPKRCGFNVRDIKKVKHPYDDGFLARKGLDY